MSSSFEISPNYSNMKTTKEIIFLLIATTFLVVQAQTDPDASRSLEELVASHGFALETHSVTTEDRYILKVHRVVPINYNQTDYSITRKPVIVFHGVLCQSPIFYMNSPFLTAPNSTCGDNFGFGMVLSGRYDLWVANARGNGISMGHLDYDSSWNSDFWKFDWDEIAYYDIPAFVKLVRSRTGHNSVGYIGYSQGGATVLALLSRRREFAQYLKPVITWAPSAYLGQATTIAKLPLIASYPLIQAIPGKFLISESWLNTVGSTLCPLWLINGVCKALLDAVLGQSNSVNATRIPVYLHFFPSPGSNWQAGHFGQQFQKGRFARFDYLNAMTNIEKYGLPTPPDYPLANIEKSTQIVVMYGQTDAVVDIKDNQLLIQNLQKFGIPTIDHRVKKDVWSHFDFVAGQGAGQYVYDPTIAYLDQYVVQDGPQ